MKLVIFDLDLTLINTRKCQGYLKTSGGRSLILDKIENNEIETNLYDEGFPDYINNLISEFEGNESDLLPVVISNSPKDYCIALLRKHKFNFKKELIFGSAGKPVVDFDCIKSELYAITNKSVTDIVVVGDNPKDIHFAHDINSPSIWASWGYDSSLFQYSFRWCSPTKQADNLAELKKLIESYKKLGVEYFEYQKPNFLKDWGMTKISSRSYIEHGLDCEIGFADLYNPEGFKSEDWREKSTYYNLHRTIKQSKNVPQHLLNQRQTFITHDKKKKEAMSLKQLAGIFFECFQNWLNEKGITGNVLLVSAPSSFPVECYNSFTVNIIAEWWSQWNKLPNLELISTDLFVERFKPKKASHHQPGFRNIDEQICTLGIVQRIREDIQQELSAVVFLDDVTTSGTTFRSMATLFRELQVVRNDIPLLAYALYKTERNQDFIKV